MPCFAASLESLLVFVVIVLLSSLSNWLKERSEKRKQGERQLPPERDVLAPGPLVGTEPQTSSPTEAKGPEWERELRRLFGEEDAPPVQRPAPPPLLVPAPKVSTAPPVTIRRFEVPPRDPEPEVQPIKLPPGTHFAPTAEALDQEGAPTFELAGLAESANAYLRASQLQEHAAARMQQAVALTSHPVAESARRVTRQRSPEVSRVLNQLQRPATARETVLATMILGTPRSLERF